MSRLSVLLTLGIVLLLAASVSAQTVTIVYPRDGMTLPFTDPAPDALKSAYFTSSFSVTTKGDDKVEWGFDRGVPLGTAAFYDQISCQFTHKLPGGSHVFWVRCGRVSKMVSFQIGK